MRGVEGLPYDEQVRSLSLFALEEGELRAPTAKACKVTKKHGESEGRSRVLCLHSHKQHMHSDEASRNQVQNRQEMAFPSFPCLPCNYGKPVLVKGHCKCKKFVQVDGKKVLKRSIQSY